ncbi:unnamed protein product [Microthlaspi erraticum]|uniref:Uncharacterized protein n=1 Tax=Microthlaspi erraticum TaxID=1685480 RepID=A0A6D2KTL9_9BRAS|nr:unnamed protein product [Microthlaspi erraticum]
MAEREEQDQNRFQVAVSCDSGDSVEGGDVGKSRGKTEKAMVLDGHCRWKSPVKTGKVNHLTVSTTLRKIKNLFGISISTKAARKCGSAKVQETCLWLLFMSFLFVVKFIHLVFLLESLCFVCVLCRVVKENNSLVKRPQSQDLKSQLSTEAENAFLLVMQPLPLATF